MRRNHFKGKINKKLITIDKNKKPLSKKEGMSTYLWFLFL